MASNSTYLDGDFSRATPVGPKRWRYPFRGNGDRVSAMFDEDHWQTESTWTPAELGVRHPTLTDFYLIAEGDRQRVLADIVQFPRTYARIPATQTTYTSQAITKPNVNNYGTATNFQQVIGPGTSSNLGANYVYFAFAWDIVNRRVYGPQVAVTNVSSGSDRRITWTGHGLTGVERIAITNNASIYLFGSGQYSVVDANTIDLTGWSGLTLVDTAAKYLRDYTPGTDRVNVQLVQNFYLPGVTAGIATPMDIPIPSPLLNDVEFLSAVVTNITGYVTYDASDLTQWMDGPIYTQTLRKINMADV